MTRPLPTRVRLGEVRTLDRRATAVVRMIRGGIDYATGLELAHSLRGRTA